VQCRIIGCETQGLPIACHSILELPGALKTGGEVRQYFSVLGVGLVGLLQHRNRVPIPFVACQKLAVSLSGNGIAGVAGSELFRDSEGLGGLAASVQC
jgi:hypothetical protein